MHTGGCACGGVRYELDGELEAIQLCHCSVCRRSNGTAFAANIPVPARAFRLTLGADLLREFEFVTRQAAHLLQRLRLAPAQPRRRFPDTLRIRAGTLDAPVEVRPAFHFFVGSKADWWEITDDLPQYEARRPA